MITKISPLIDKVRQVARILKTQKNFIQVIILCAILNSVHFLCTHILYLKGYNSTTEYLGVLYQQMRLSEMLGKFYRSTIILYSLSYLSHSIFTMLLNFDKCLTLVNFQDCNCLKN